jgi:serine/threonine-protein kinase RsbW
MVGDIALHHGFPADAAHEIQFATDEACTNAMQHGCSGHTDRVRLSIVCHPTGLDVDVIDWGAGFAFKGSTEQQLDQILATMPSRGMGLPIIRTLMDEVDYLAGTPQGNVLRMRKTRSPTPTV